MDLAKSTLAKTQSPLSDLSEQYIAVIWQKVLIGCAFALILIALLILSLGVGSLQISTGEIVATLFGSSQSNLSHVIWDIRLTRAVGAAIAGAGLAVAGAVMQNVLKNPLASPFTIGISQGAAFGATFAIIFLDAGIMHRTGNELVTVKNPYIVTLSAFACSLLSVAFILALSSLRRVTPESIILAGVALSAFFGSATMFMQYFASDVQVAATVFWTFGDIGKASWQAIVMMALVLAFSCMYFVFKRWDYNALLWGDDTAMSLGVKVKTLRVYSMLLCSLIVAVITSFLGIIGFIGLIAPHIVRFILGSDYRFLIPYSALCGGILLLVSDIIARTVLAPVLLPVGIITSFAGAPMFLYLLIKMRRT